MAKNKNKNKGFVCSYTQNRELSWLKFDQRVLEEAKDDNVPLLEKLNFVSIFTSNLDEFYMVRCGTLYDLTLVNDPNYYDNKTGWGAQEQLDKIYEETIKLYQMQDEIYHDILTELSKKGIVNLNYKDLTSQEKDFIKNYFTEFILPVLTPVMIGKNHPLPHLRNKALNIVLELKDEEGLYHAAIPIPKSLPRVIYPSEGMKNFQSEKIKDLKSARFILLEKIILHFAEEIFSNYEVIEKAIISVTRNADINLSTKKLDDDEDYRHHMKTILKNRSRLAPIRLEIYKNTNPYLRLILCNYLNLNLNQSFVSNTPLDMSYSKEIFDKVSHEYFKDLFYVPYTQQITNELTDDPLIPQIKKKNVLIFYPYESMDTFLRLLKEAAKDPKVISIKMTIYRLSSSSKVIKYLLEAADNGKEVTVLMELKARFDEQNNIRYTELLEEEGCNILYGFEDFKVHSKLCLITRKEEDNKLTYTTQIGTGNYNEKTSKVYSDFCYITSNKSICNDVVEFFNNMELSQLKGNYKTLLVAPYGFRKTMIKNIKKAIKRAENGEKAIIIMKMNSLTDKKIIDYLERASKAGVKIKLIVRGICTLVPGVIGHTDNISVISIVGRFLEHTRIYCFGVEPEDNSNDSPESLLKMYISSADMMTRNTQKRVEIATPIKDKKVKKQIYHILDVFLHDNVKARKLNNEGFYEKIESNSEKIDAQAYFMEEYEKKDSL
jgi:polyphosphate kinase